MHRVSGLDTSQNWNVICATMSMCCHYTSHTTDTFKSMVSYKECCYFWNQHLPSTRHYVDTEMLWQLMHDSPASPDTQAYTSPLNGYMSVCRLSLIHMTRMKMIVRSSAKKLWIAVSCNDRPVPTHRVYSQCLAPNPSFTVWRKLSDQASCSERISVHSPIADG